MIKKKTGTLKHALSFAIVASVCLFMLQCRATRGVIEDAVSPITDKLTGERLPELPPEKAYAGEVLAYMMQLILGRAGSPDLQNEWATRGLDVTLDFKNISGVMTNPDRLKTDLMVLDTNILGLSEVLYYYDRNLNLVKDDSRHASIYPSPELIAIRLLLLQKISRGETINLKSLLERDTLLLDGEVEPTSEDLDATNLNADEMMLLKGIFENAPYLYDYLNSNFLVDAFYEAGVIENDGFVKKKVAKANYKPYNCRHFGGSYNNNAVKISFLPSMTKEFRYGDSHEGLSHYGFKPTEHFNEMANKLKNEILEKTKSIVYEKIHKETSTISRKEWETLWERIVREKITFYNEDERPLVIYPANAQEVVQDVCPKADFTVILLGKDVYLSMHIETGKDTYPDVNRLYIDLVDVKYGQVQEEVNQIGEFICSQLKDYLRESVKTRTQSARF